jgi:hypothetical protein
MTFAAMLGIVTVVLYGSVADAQTTLVPGGLMALPPTSYGPNLLQNPSFGTLSGGFPVGWSAGSGWSADQLLFHSGPASYRRTTGAATSTQTVQLKAGTYLLSAWIKTDSLGSGSTSGVRLTLDFRPGGINAWWPSDVISGTNDWKLYQVGPIVVATDRTAAVLLENYAGAAGTAWFDDVSLVQILPPPVDVFLLYPNYRGMLFDDQPQTMQLDVTVTPPGGDFGRYDVRASLADETSGQVIAQQSFPAAAHLVATLDGSPMQAGRGYLARVSLVDRSTSNVVSTYPAYRVSKVAGSARQSMNVSFDAKNRVVLKGVPRFVLGVYDSGLGYSSDPTYWETTLWSPAGDRRMSGLKINMYLNYHYGQAPTDAMAALMTNLQQHGVMYLQTGNCFDKFPADSTFPINGSDSYVSTLGGHAGSAGYYTIDECLSSLQPGSYSQYQRLRSLDADSLTFAALLGNPDIALWRDSADVLASDPYPLFGAEPSGGYPLVEVADWTALTRSAVKDARPFMTVLQFFKFTSQGRFPTLAEMRSMAYMAVVEGARGLWWWSIGTSALADVCAGWCAERTAYMSNLKSVVNEIAVLEPALLSDDAPGVLTGNSNTGAIRTKVKVVGNTGYVFAYNHTASAQSATFTLSAAPSSVTVNAEARTIAPAATSFVDAFGPYQAHVYVLGNVAATPLTVSFTTPIANATVSATIPVAVSAGGGSGTGYTYAITADGQTIASGNNSSVSWDTTTVADGPRTLAVTVRDSIGATASASRSVTVSNVSAPPSSPSGDIVIDNGTPGTSATGTWCASGASDFFGADSLYSCGGGADTYRWTPTLAAGGTYDVYVWWSSHPNRSTSVPITVVHSAGSSTQSFNEQTGGGRWVLHGRYSFTTGAAGYVQVSSTNGQAAADAVRLVPSGAPPAPPTEMIVDNGTPGTSATGTWCASAASDFFGTDSLFSCGGGIDTYRWTPTLAAGGTYDVYVWWSSFSYRSTSVPITVVHSAGSSTQSFNEQTGGGRWVLHGRYSFTAGTAGYVQASSANGQAAADAVRFVLVP